MTNREPQIQHIEPEIRIEEDELVTSLPSSSQVSNEPSRVARKINIA